ncbi:hypothetical protein [Kocuria rosea]|uniref:hypothetical protein n=1 Tax=Kocuria rosea TaxID=1275 RepID=UPI0025413676|nr:hypothetical protein [Kocuria rosea]WIG18397.1 hypothetical protein QOY29_05565 [Kocuria rosea]
MADSNTISATTDEGGAPEWVLNDECVFPGSLDSGRNFLELAAIRASLCRSGAYDLPPELTTEANEIAAECADLLPLLKRVASRWVDFERAAVRHYADVPDRDNLSVPCAQNPDRRKADVAIQAVADAVDHNRLCGLAYDPKAPAAE